MIFTVITVIYLITVGFPSSVENHVRTRLEARGHIIRFDGLRLHPGGALIADDARYFMQPDDAIPTLEAEIVLIRVPPSTWFQRKNDRGMITIDARNLIGRLILNEAVLREVTAVQFHADIQWTPEAVLWTSIDLRAPNLRAQGQGDVLRGDGSVPSSTAARLLAWRTRAEEQRAWIEKVLDEWDMIELLEPAHITFNFHVQAGDADKTTLTVDSQGQGTRIRGLIFDAWSLAVEWAPHHMQCKQLVLRHEDRRFELTGTYDRSAETIQTRIYMNLLPVYWRNLLPSVIREHKTRARIHSLGPTEAVWEMGPSVWSEFGRSGHGWIRAEQVDAHGVWIESMSCEVALANHEVHLTKIDAVVGRADEQGAAQGDAMISLSEGTYSGALTASFNPHAVLPVAGYSRTAARVIQALSIQTDLPHVDVAFWGDIGLNPDFHFTGRISGRDFVYQGSAIQSFDSHFHLTNRVLRIDPLHVVRAEGELTGWYEQDFNRSIVDLDVHSRIDPRALARVGRGAVERILRPFRFDGPVDVVVSGRVDYDEHAETDYRAVGVAEQIGWRWVMADRCSMEWVAQGDQIVMNDVVLDIYGGKLEGDVVLSNLGAREVQYDVRGQVRDIQLPEFIQAVRQREGEVQRGVVFGRFALSGLSEDDWKASITGRGRIRIEEGEIFQIPLFGGLSDLLRWIYPRLGFAVQTDARASFDVHDRRIHSDNIRIEGNILSLSGRGYYELDDELKFKVQVQPLRRGIIVDAIRLVTYPVSRLLQVYLEGTLTEPKWGIDNLPRELWGTFEREAADDEP